MRQFYFIGLLIISSLLNAQISEVFDINDGTGNSSPANLTVHSGMLYFGADDSSGVNTGGMDSGKELWVSDGTKEGTHLLTDLNSGDSGSNPFAFFELNDVLYFSANDGAGSRIFSTDGTESGTINTNNGFSNLQPIVVNGKAYMTATTNGNSFYEFDGTTFQQVPDVGSGSSLVIGGVYTALDNDSILVYMDYSTETDTVGRELYLYSITNQTYTLVKDIDAGTGDSSISNFTKLDNKVYFEADNELWVTDGTESGTVKITVAETAAIIGVNNMYAWNSQLFFEGDDGNGDQLWVYNPTTDTVTNISNISGDNVNHDPSDYVEYSGYLYYRGEDATDTDGHLFRTDGSSIEQVDNTIKDIDDIVVFDNKLYFEGDNGVNGNELFVYDATSLSVSNVDFKQSLSIYPNPSTNRLNIQSSLTGSIDYSIYNVIGKEVLSGEVTNTFIDHNLSSGIYMLQLINGSNSITKKIVVKN